MNNTEWMRTRLLEAAGLSDTESRTLEPMQSTFLEILKSEWDVEFEAQMRARLLVGSFRYGRLRDPSRPNYDAVSSAIERLEAFRLPDGGNRELLVDAANLCLVEFVRRTHPNSHWAPTDDGEHAKQIVSKS